MLAAAAKSLQSCLTLWDPIDGSPLSSSVPGILQARSGLPFPSPMHESEKWKWSCSVMPNSQRSHGLQPTRLLCPWDSPGKEWVAISLSNAWKWKVKVKLLSHAQLLATPWTAAYQAPLSMGFSRQEYWSGVPSPSLIVVISRYEIKQWTGDISTEFGHHHSLSIL